MVVAWVAYTATKSPPLCRVCRFMSFFEMWFQVILTRVLLSTSFNWACVFQLLSKNHWPHKLSFWITSRFNLSSFKGFLILWSLRVLNAMVGSTAGQTFAAPAAKKSFTRMRITRRTSPRNGSDFCWRGLRQQRPLTSQSFWTACCLSLWERRWGSHAR